MNYLPFYWFPSLFKCELSVVSEYGSVKLCRSNSPHGTVGERLQLPVERLRDIVLRVQAERRVELLVHECPCCHCAEFIGVCQRTTEVMLLLQYAIVFRNRKPSRCPLSLDNSLELLLLSSKLITCWTLRTASSLFWRPQDVTSRYSAYVLLLHLLCYNTTVRPGGEGGEEWEGHLIVFRFWLQQ